MDMRPVPVVRPAPGILADTLAYTDKLRARLSAPMTPINQRRWENFKANRRGYWSLILFVTLFGLSLIAPLIASDKPILVRYKGETLYPQLVNYPESKFGGFLAVTDYKDPQNIEEIEKNGWMLWPPIRYSYRTENKDYPLRKAADGTCLGYPAPPPWATKLPYCDAPAAQMARYTALGNRNWLGLDDQGRDVLARIIYGFRISVLFGLILTSISSVIGIIAGAVQGYFGGKVDLVMQRFIEVWTSMPELFVLLIISSILVPGFWTLLGILLVFNWVGLVSVVRAEFLRGRNLEYVRAARALGLSDRQIMFKHILPNAMVATITYLPFQFSGGIGSLTALDFLGLGLPPGSPSLGELLLQGKKHLEAPWLGISGFVSIAVTLSLLIFIGEAVRDALDPRKTFR
jgi:microcin C transport system permease protein